MSNGRSFGPVPPLVERLLAEQRQRWRRGDRVPVEAYLGQHPALRGDAEAVLHLVFNEVVLREQAGEAPCLDDYQSRFPHLAAELGLQFAMDRALGADLLATSTVVARTQTSPGQRPPEPAGLPSLPGYEILAELGRGGMGVVYQAWQTSLGRMVALKMVLSGAHAGPEGLARFRNEAEAVARLQHPNIVQIYEVGAHDARPYFALEYVEGDSLERELAGTPRPPREAARLVEVLARAMDYAHQKGIVHRDLKPANVLLSFSREAPASASSEALTGISRLNAAVPKITDFGLAKVLVGARSDQTKSGAILGTPSYMAPEQARGEGRKVGPAADVYALGAVLYELLTGRPPFKGETLEETLLQVLTADPVPPSRLRPKTPRDLETVALKCLAKEPAKRYASALDLAEDLRRFLAGEPTAARPVGQAGRLWRWCRRRPAVAGLLGLLAAVVVGALVGLTALWQRAERLRHEAEVKQIEAEAANAEALEYFGVARDAINGYAERVKEDPQLREADLRPLRKELLATVVPFYERLTRREGTRSSIQAEQAQAFGRLAQITLDVDDPAKAVEQHRAAIGILERLAAERPDEPRYLFQLAELRHNLAALYSTDPDCQDQGEGELLKSIAIKEDLAARYPDNREYQQVLALGLHNLGATYENTRRRDLAEAPFRRALTIQEELVNRHPEVLDYKEELALSRSNLGRVHLGKGQKDEAEKEQGEAVRLQEDVTRQRPSDLRSQYSLAGSRIALSKLFSETGRREKAAVELDRAIQALGPVTRNCPSHFPCQEALAECHTKLAWLHADADKAAEAESELQKAAEIRQFLARLQPNRVAARNELALAHAELGRLHDRRKESAKADAQYQMALAMLEEVTRDHPDATSSLVLLGQTCHNRAFCLRSGGQTQAALPWYARAQGYLDNLLKKQPQNGDARTILVQLHWDRAAAYMTLARYDAALQDWDRALALDDGQRRDRFRISRAVVLAHLGRHAQAVAEVEELAGAKAPEALNAFHAACACAVSSATVRDDAALEPADRARLAERYAGRAVALLQRLHQAGYFKSARRVKDLKTEKDLGAVRARDEFQALVASVEEQAKAPAP